MSSSEVWSRYETEEQLTIHEAVGRGGFGKVYRAHHLRLDTTVAVKVLNETVRSMPLAAKLFAREAQIMARIDHPNVLRVFDYRQGPEGPYVVTEWMSEGSVKPGLKDESAVLAAALAAASGLQALHEAGVVHRDIKPDNLFRRQDGRIKLGDLGVALELDAKDDQQLVGSIAYMAPELFDDPPAYGEAADIYALGVTLYQLWTGRLPFHGRTFAEMRSEIRHASPIPLEQARPGLGSELRHLIELMMHRASHARPSAREVLTQLPAALEDPRLAATKQATSSHRFPIDSQGVVSVGPWVVTRDISLTRTWLGLLAHHRDTGRQYRLIRFQGSDREMTFLVESSKASAKWSHPHLVSVVDWGQWDGGPYLVCESIGHRLFDVVLARGPMREIDALEVIEQVGAALAYIHDKGFVYQMVAPTAVGSHPSGSGWMLDCPCFCQPIDARVGKHQEWKRVVSPGFAAPEVPKASTFGPAADVYGLGATLAFCLTGVISDWLEEASDREWAIGYRLPDVSAVTRTLIAELTAPAPSARPSASEALDWIRSLRAKL